MRRDRSQITVRELRPDDHAVDEVFAGMSERSRYLRFHRVMPRLPHSVRAHLLDVDGRDRIGLVAEVRSGWRRRAVGLAELYRTHASEAEIAGVVADRWQGLGIGGRLLRELARRAPALGVDQLTAEVLPENRTMLRVLRRTFPAGATASGDGVVRFLAPLRSEAYGFAPVPCPC